MPTKFDDNKLSRKHVGGVEFRFAETGTGDGGSSPAEFSGYASVFNRVDSYQDAVAPGAFKKTLDEWGAKGKLPVLLLQHGGWGASVDDLLPAGIWTKMEEDDYGLRVEGRLFGMDTDRGRLIHEGMVSGALDGLSIGFITRSYTVDEDPEAEIKRTLTDIDLIEISIVTFPALDPARVDPMSMAANAKSRQDLEDILHHSYGAPEVAIKAAFDRFEELTIDRKKEVVGDIRAHVAARLHYILGD